jgi:CNP1-like family
MKFKPLFLAFWAFSFCLSGAVWAQNPVDELDWKESEVPAPPAFDVSKLVTFEVSASSSLVYGVDPASIRITHSDGVVRYVMVATSASGARNVMYEGLRCSTGEFKTYARYSADGRWSAVSQPEWRSLFGNMPSKHALRFAQAGGCDNATAPSSVKVLVGRLKNPNFKITE